MEIFARFWLTKFAKITTYTVLSIFLCVFSCSTAQRPNIAKIRFERECEKIIILPWGVVHSWAGYHPPSGTLLYPVYWACLPCENKEWMSIWAIRIRISVVIYNPLVDTLLIKHDFSQNWTYRLGCSVINKVMQHNFFFYLNVTHFEGFYFCLWESIMITNSKTNCRKIKMWNGTEVWSMRSLN